MVFVQNVEKNLQKEAVDSLFFDRKMIGKGVLKRFFGYGDRWKKIQYVVYSQMSQHNIL